MSGDKNNYSMDNCSVCGRRCTISSDPLNRCRDCRKRDCKDCGKQFQPKINSGVLRCSKCQEKFRRKSSKVLSGAAFVD